MSTYETLLSRRAGVTVPAGLRRTAPPVPGEPAARMRVAIYAVALGVAFALCLLVQGPGQGTAFWAAAVAAGLGLASGVVSLGRAFQWGVGGVFAVALAIPVVPELWERAAGPMTELVPLWPQILVGLFASRVLSERAAVAYARFWRFPLQASPNVQVQSLGAAVALGACLTCVFYDLLWIVAPERVPGTATGAIVLNALGGRTPIHRAILFLFFVLLAFAIDAARQCLRDRGVLGAVQVAIRDGGAGRGRADLRAWLGRLPADQSASRAARLLCEALDAVEPPSSGQRVLEAAAFGAFHLASRRFVRGLLPFLPLLGFFGTVVGLATAMAALPTGPGTGGTIDISGSLAGLAVKFETTLLGIMASMVASFLLGLVERWETEMAAACSLVIEAAGRGHAP